MRDRSATAEGDGGGRKQSKGWMEAEYDRYKRARRKKSGNCILEVKVPLARWHWPGRAAAGAAWCARTQVRLCSWRSLMNALSAEQGRVHNAPSVQAVRYVDGVERLLR